MSLFEKLGLDRLFYKDSDTYEFEEDYEDDEFEEEYVYQPFSVANIIEIILTGGPHSGKSELVRLAADELKAKKIPVFVVNETAKELFKDNIVYDDPLSLQRAVCTVQLAKEKAMQDYVCAYLRRTEQINAVIIYDRSAWDGRAYIEDKIWRSSIEGPLGVYSTLGYRFVIHLESVAAIGRFSKENDAESFEDDENAIRLDKRLFDVYRSHPLFAHIPAREDYEQKKAEFLKVISAFVDSRLVVEKTE